ncbi:MAG: hypothetical protein LBS05_11115 [Tannerellaceae bacterium]|nr:hypothetical protein [Tannerellaceae bacterium]
MKRQRYVLSGNMMTVGLVDVAALHLQSKRSTSPPASPLARGAGGEVNEAGGLFIHTKRYRI